MKLTKVHSSCFDTGQRLTVDDSPRANASKQRTPVNLTTRDTKCCPRDNILALRRLTHLTNVCEITEQFVFHKHTQFFTEAFCILNYSKGNYEYFVTLQFVSMSKQNMFYSNRRFVCIKKKSVNVLLSPKPGHGWSNLAIIIFIFVDVRR